MVPRKRLMREPEAHFGNREGSTGSGEDNDRAGEPGTGRGGRGVQKATGENPHRIHSSLEMAVCFSYSWPPPCLTIACSDPSFPILCLLIMTLTTGLVFLYHYTKHNLTSPSRLPQFQP